MTLIETLNDYATNMWPEYHLVAGEHKFECKCGACILFLALTGLEAQEKCPEWVALRSEKCPTEHNEHLNRPMGIPTDSQIERIHALASRYL